MLSRLRSIPRRLRALPADIRRAVRRSNAARAISGKPRPWRLHVGCGQVRFPGWIHLDANPQLQGIDALWFADDGFPCPDASVEYIYNEHFLEHLPIEMGIRFLKECRRVLQPGGVVRIAMPDMEQAVRHYVSGEWKQQPWMAQYGFSWIKTGCEYLNISFRSWEHQWLYDHVELRRRLADAGFTQIVDRPLYESDHPELRQRETRPESALICEASP